MVLEATRGTVFLGFGYTDELVSQSELVISQVIETNASTITYEVLEH